jgi:hypothetical protein
MIDYPSDAQEFQMVIDGMIPDYEAAQAEGDDDMNDTTADDTTV